MQDTEIEGSRGRPRVCHQWLSPNIESNAAVGIYKTPPSSINFQNGKRIGNTKIITTKKINCKGNPTFT
ncbi:MAG: hypothetical protein BWY08_00658 [Bacteroidetes bacterium ADurb.Bin174]|nr:MAG: hypothetical protein BWY08_00658 [Bacteroidetes bacterium ADurb.Bin174]